MGKARLFHNLFTIKKINSTRLDRHHFSSSCVDVAQCFSECDMSRSQIEKFLDESVILEESLLSSKLGVRRENT